MVHYGEPEEGARQPARACPKCGSHRTEVVGRSDDATTITVRCSACEARTRVSAAGGHYGSQTSALEPVT